MVVVSLFSQVVVCAVMPADSAPIARRDVQSRAARAGRGSRPRAGHQREQQRRAAGEGERCAQADVLAQPAAEQRLGPAGMRMSQRIVLVMRPSSGSGVTAWRSARKLMNTSTAPAPNISSISARRRCRGGQPARGASRPQPVPHREAQRQAAAGADAAADAIAPDAARHRAPGPCRCSSARWPAPTGPACASPGGSAPPARRDGTSARRPPRRPAPPAGAGCARKHAGAQVAPEMRVGARCGARRRRCRAGWRPRSSIAASTSSASGAPTSRISTPAKPASHLGARAGERVLGVRLHQPLAQRPPASARSAQPSRRWCETVPITKPTTYSQGMVSQPATTPAARWPTTRASVASPTM